MSAHDADTPLERRSNVRDTEGGVNAARTHAQASRRRWIAGGVALAGAAGCWPLLAGAANDATATRLPDVELVDQDGRRHALRALGNGPVLLSFFYTGCSSVCPPQTASLRAMRQQLQQAKNNARLPLILSITVDPLGDTPQALRSYAQRFGVRLGLDQGWLMLTGNASDLAVVWRAFDVPTSGAGDHPSTLWFRREPAQRWTRASALADPAQLAAIVLQGKD